MRLLAWALKLRAVSRLPVAFGHLTLRGLSTEQRHRWSARLLADAGVRRDMATLLKGVDRRYTLDAAEHFAEVQQPVLVLWGATKNAFPVHLGERLAADLPNARLELVQESSAFLSIDAPEAMAEAIDRFVTEVQDSGEPVLGSARAPREEGRAPR